MTTLWPDSWLPAAWSVGWILLHFVWQGTLLAAVTAAALAVLGRERAGARYLVCCAALGLAVLAPLFTWWLLPSPAAATDGGAALATLVVTESLRTRLLMALPALTAFWVVGVTFMQLRLVAQFVGARLLGTRGLGALPPACERMVAELAEQLGLPARRARAKLSHRAPVPLVVGWLRPLVLVPATAVTGLSSEQLRAVLCHELAHVRRHDPLVNLAQNLVETVFFFHPAVWWLSGRLRVEREFCCDDVAVETCGDRLTYATALAALDDLGAPVQPALAATGGTLMPRIARILQSPRPQRAAGGWLAPVTLTAALLLGFSATGVAGDDEGAEPSPLRGVDLVEVVGQVDAEQGHLLGVLRQAGLDDETLLAVVSRMGSAPQVLEAVESAVNRAELRRRVGEAKHHLMKTSKQLHELVEQGALTEEDAKHKLHEQMRSLEELHAEYAAVREAHELRFGDGDVERPVDVDARKAHVLEGIRLERHGKELEQHILEVRRAVEAGLIDKVEAVGKLEALEKQLVELQRRRVVLEEVQAAEGNEFVVLHEPVVVGVETIPNEPIEIIIEEVPVQDENGELVLVTRQWSTEEPRELLVETVEPLHGTIQYGVPFTPEGDGSFVVFEGPDGEHSEHGVLHEVIEGEGGWVESRYRVLEEGRVHHEYRTRTESPEHETVEGHEYRTHGEYRDWVEVPAGEAPEIGFGVPVDLSLTEVGDGWVGREPPPPPPVPSEEEPEYEIIETAFSDDFGGEFIEEIVEDPAPQVGLELVGGTNVTVDLLPVADPAADPVAAENVALHGVHLQAMRGLEHAVAAGEVTLSSGREAVRVLLELLAPVSDPAAGEPLPVVEGVRYEPVEPVEPLETELDAEALEALKALGYIR